MGCDSSQRTVRLQVLVTKDEFALIEDFHGRDRIRRPDPVGMPLVMKGPTAGAPAIR
jgi:hypothetical protein